MQENNSTTTENDAFANRITFILLLIVEIPAILCTLLILIFFFSHWQIMMIKVLHHHAVFLLTIITFFYITLDLPFSINKYRLGYDNFRSPSFCLWWFWLDYTLSSTSLLLTATASIQRHILIFHSHWFRMQRRRWLFHFIPLILCNLYPAFFYISFIFFYPCEYSFEANSRCKYPCYADNITLYNLDWFANYICSVIIIVLANCILIGRVICTRPQSLVRQSHTWKKARKLTMQLLSFSSVYVLGWIPSLCVSFLQVYFIPNLFIDNPGIYYIHNTVYFVCPVQSFISLFALPELINFIKNNINRIFPRPIPASLVTITPNH